MNYLICGGLNINNSNDSIEKEILKYSDKILYCALASNNYANSYNLFKKKINKDIPILTITDLNGDYLSKIKAAEVLYFAGGNSNLLVKLVKEYNILAYLDNIKLIVGISAGAIMLASFGFGDKDVFIDDGIYYNFKMVDGIGKLNIVVCPHYQKLGIDIFNQEVKKYALDAYALEDDTALLFSDNNLVKIIKNDSGMSCFILKKSNNYQLVPLTERNI